MGCMVLNALCCAGQSCCSALCCCCKECGVRSKHQSKIGFAFIQILFLLIALTVMLNIGDIEDGDNWYDIFLKDDSTDVTSNEVVDTTLGVRIVLRMSFTLTLFHSIVLILSIPGYIASN